MRLIDNWRRAPKMLSMWAMALAGAVQGAWAIIPQEMQASLPPSLVQGVTLGLLVLGIAGRLVKQEGVTP